MNKILLSATIAIVLLSISLSSAVCLNCNSLNSQVKYYQDAEGCKFYSSSSQPVFYETQVKYAIYTMPPPLPPPPMPYPMIKHQQHSHYYDYDEDDEDNSQEKCDWHLLFFRFC